LLNRPAFPRRGSRAWLSRHARLYLRLMRWTGRGCLEKRIYVALIRPGDVVLDVGAHHGEFTTLFAALAGSRGEVHAFEPGLSGWARLDDEIRRGRLDNVFLNPVACAERDGNMTLYIPGEHTAQSSLRPHCQGTWGTGLPVAERPVPAIRLDGYGRGSVPQRVDFVKCDVEGAELPVLRGMKNMLARWQPLLFLEACSAWTESFAYRPEEMVPFLEACGYDRFYLVAGRVLPMDDAPRRLAAATAGPETVNVLCARLACHGARLRALDGV
jgi:FkbM family methyltransferase